MSALPAIFQVQGTCNNYPWGQKGRHSLAARLCEKTSKATKDGGRDSDSFTIQDDQFYSELWFGDYPTFPTKILGGSGQPLHEAISQNKESLLGRKTVERHGGQLPYLPKVRT
jgi:mannose-6-phosphate isomerase